MQAGTRKTTAAASGWAWLVLPLVLAACASGPVGAVRVAPAQVHRQLTAYASAHIDGVESERVVRSGHSTQGHPDTIAEVHRILLLHAATP